MPDMSTIPDWLREMRRRRGWGQRAAATHLGMHQPNYARWESDRGTPLHMHQRILNALGREVAMPPFPFTDPYATRRGDDHPRARKARRDAAQRGS